MCATAPLRAVFYARVSSDQQAARCPIDSSVAALLARAAADSQEIQAELRFLDNGHSGASWSGPSWSALIDSQAAGGIRQGRA